MGKITLSVDVDSELVRRLEAAGVEPACFVERALKRQCAIDETAEQRSARASQWRTDNAAELESYDMFMADHADWNEDLRTF